MDGPKVNTVYPHTVSAENIIFFEVEVRQVFKEGTKLYSRMATIDLLLTKSMIKHT